MASITFSSGTTITSTWLNDVDALVWDVFGGATTVGTARSALGLGTMATQAASSVAITGGSITGITDLAVADGGTGASTVADARTNLGAAASGAATSSGITIATSKLLGRTTASTGALEEISVGTGLTFTSGELKSSSISAIQEFRLTLTSGTPVTTSDVTSAGTIYACPYKGNKISLYDGTNWNLRTSAEFSLALSGLTSGKPYDIFCYDNSGTPTLEFLVWTNDTTRATALAYQDGVLVKSGETTRRYLGTFYTTGTTTTEDSAANRYLWNYYHRVSRAVKKTESTASWAYTTASWRQANNSTANQINYVCGVAEDAVSLLLHVQAQNSNANFIAIYAAIGVDSVSTPSQPNARTGQSRSDYTASIVSSYYGIPGVGRHYLTWIEQSVASGTTTWYSGGDSGLHGTVFA